MLLGANPSGALDGRWGGVGDLFCFHFHNGIGKYFFDVYFSTTEVTILHQKKKTVIHTSTTVMDSPSTKTAMESLRCRNEQQ